MIIKGKQALADYLGCSYSAIDSNFPLTASKALAKGIEIIRHGAGASIEYEINKVEPKKVDKSYFSTRV